MSPKDNVAQQQPGQEENDEKPPQAIMSVSETIKKILAEESSEEKKLSIFWSGQEVIPSSDADSAVFIANSLSEIKLFPKGKKGILKKIRYTVKNIINHPLIQQLLMFCVIINTIILSLDRYNQPVGEENICQAINIAFTCLFALEMFLKIFGIGIVKYLSDGLNYLDGFVVILSLVELIFLSGQGSFTAFRAVRVFRVVRMLRTFRVVRIARLFRSLEDMRRIIRVISETLSSFAFVGLLLIIFIFIYSLFGMQLFGGRFQFSNPQDNPRQNFDSFNNAFLTVYQVLTMENWQSVLYSAMRGQIPAVAAIYLVTWIFIGNYILLNLFMAIMLDAFGDDHEEEEDDYDDIVRKINYYYLFKTKT